MADAGKDRGVPTVLIPAHVKLGWAGLLLALAAARLAPWGLRVDEITLGLLVLVAVPWLLDVVKTVRVGGFELEIRDLRRMIDTQQSSLAEQQTQINMLATYMVSASTFRHLAGIAVLRRYLYNHNEAMRREMYCLRDMGLIRGKHGFVDFDASMHERNLVEIVEPTEAGWILVRLRRAELPGDFLMDQENLRIAPSAL